MTKYELNKKRPCVVYSFGVSQDSEFENAILSRTNCEIWGYDFSVNGWASQLNKSYVDRAHFKKIGIGNTTDKLRSPPFYTVKDLMKENKHDYIDIMKMDIEGSEFDSLSAFVGEFSSPDVELPIGQLLVEIHIRQAEPQDPFEMPQTLPAWLEFWEAMEMKGMREVFIEPNLYGNKLRYGYPAFAEVSP